MIIKEYEKNNFHIFISLGILKYSLEFFSLLYGFC
ncbi:MAG: hypothetical protein PWP06_973 [Candidatus Marinimicrobia bacterium]|jgi:hypothetical protein|nr:hypothetical protein [Candidatus Neomarinimicrobiota bacterium]